MKRIWKLGSIPLILVLLLAGLGPSLALDRQTRLNVMAAVVQIGWVSEENGKLYNIGVGSGTIISPDGLILTNCHVADPVLYGMSPDELPPIDYLSVALTVRSDQPPQVAYLAEVLAADPYLDLAVLRINRKLDGRPVNAGDLNLPYVPLGDSDSVEVGDEVNIFGYPGIGGETVTFTKGVVAGFSLDAAVEGRAWIKTDATIAGGNSGGTAVDEKG
ncbi:MAG TPA: serine protease, partial [Anaerolineae bacterium]|nr:serine protease [Anaerolineae bacterium]